MFESGFVLSAKTKKRYWAVGLNFDYNIVSRKPCTEEWGSIQGPFDTLIGAKRQIRSWIASDRAHLSDELAQVMALRDSSFEWKGKVT